MIDNDLYGHRIAGGKVGVAERTPEVAATQADKHYGIMMQRYAYKNGFDTGGRPSGLYRAFSSSADIVFAGINSLRC